MDQSETNFRLALLSIKEVELATEKVKVAVDGQLQAINNLAATMSKAFEGFSLHTQIQDDIISRLTAIESAVSELKKKAS